MRIGSILSEARREGYSISIVHEPKETSAKGSFYFIAELTDAHPEAEELIKNLAETLITEYYENPDEKPAVSFERALKVANEELKDLAKDGEKTWIGNLHVIAAVVTGSKLIMAHRGTAEAHLLRGSQMMHITDSLYTPGESYRPEETLSNVLEGGLEAGDKLVLSTAELFYYYSLEQLRRIVEAHSPKAAAEKIAEKLKAEDDVNRIAVTLVEFNTPEMFVDEEEDMFEVWLNKSEAKNSFAAPSFRRRSQPEIEEAIAEAEKEIARNEPEDEPAEEEIKVRPHLYEQYEPVRNGSVGRKFSLEQKNIDQAKNIATLILSYLGKFFRGLGRLLAALFDWLIGFLTTQIAIIKRRKGGDKILLWLSLGAIGVVILTSFALVQGGRALVGSRSASDKLTEATQKKDAAQAALIYEDKGQATGLLKEALTLAQSVRSNRRLAADAEKLIGEIQQELDNVTNTKRVSPSLVVDFAQSGEGMSVSEFTTIGKDLYALDTAAGKLYKFNSGSGQTGSVANLQDSTKKFTTLTNQDGSILIQASPPSVYRYSPQTNNLSGVKLQEGDWNNAFRIKSFGTNLYFLDTVGNQIWKYRKTDNDTYSKIPAFFEAEDDRTLASADSLAIDGFVYVLTDHKNINKYASGLKENFELKNLPDVDIQLNNIQAVFATGDTEGIYILDRDNRRVVMVDKEGNYIRQYIFSDLSNADDLAVNPAAQEIYIRTGAKIYKLSF